jgi:uncharacterized protein (DUF2345 family)
VGFITPPPQFLDQLRNPPADFGKAAGGSKAELVSPNGKNKISVTDDGIELRAGDYLVVIDARNKKVTIAARGGDIEITAGNEVRLSGIKGVDVSSDKSVKLLAKGGRLDLEGENVKVRGTEAIVLQSVTTMDIQSAKVTINKDALEVT